jgi:Kinesin motor domain
MLYDSQSRSMRGHLGGCRCPLLQCTKLTISQVLCTPPWGGHMLTKNKPHVQVAGLHEECVTCPEAVLQLLAGGEAHRHFGETKMNVKSSRSHTIFRMVRSVVCFATEHTWCAGSQLCSLQPALSCEACAAVLVAASPQTYAHWDGRLWRASREMQTRRRAAP